MAETTTSRGVMHTFSRLLAVCNGVALLAYICMLLVSRNRLAEVYSEYGAPLSAATRFIISTHWTLWMAIAIALLSVITLTESLVPAKRVSITMHLAFAILGVLLASILWHA